MQDLLRLNKSIERVNLLVISHLIYMLVFEIIKTLSRCHTLDNLIFELS